ncbi:MAG: hypothetical protein IJF61_04150 [Clostridia bacterium]|nr:hypothetical protein [Clostridia bacterium]
MKKIAKLLTLVFGLTMILMLSACGTSNEPCVYCEKTPTKSYKTATGDTTYICKEHRSTCFFCNKKATKHYTSGLGLEIFTCKDCYKEATK